MQKSITYSAFRVDQIIFGGLVIAIADVLCFSAYWRDPVGVFQYIAGGLLGKEAAFSGGVSTAILGAILHILIAVAFVAAYAVACRQLSAVGRRPYLFGPLYGMVAYCVMNYLVIPFSRLGAPTNAPPTDWWAINIAFHLIVVGFVSAYFARRSVETISS